MVPHPEEQGRPISIVSRLLWRSHRRHSLPPPPSTATSPLNPPPVALYLLCDTPLVQSAQSALVRLIQPLSTPHLVAQDAKPRGRAWSTAPSMPFKVTQNRPVASVDRSLFSRDASGRLCCNPQGCPCTRAAPSSRVWNLAALVYQPVKESRQHLVHFLCCVRICVESAARRLWSSGCSSRGGQGRVGRACPKRHGSWLKTMTEAFIHAS